MSAYEVIYVEGSDDQVTLDKIFAIKGKFEVAGRKAKVFNNVQKESTCYGIVDRDFDSDESVERSRETDSRCVILKRYSLENYLLEPKYLLQLAKDFGFSGHEQWNSEQAIEQMLIRLGQELSHCAAANELLGRYARQINFQQFPIYFNKFAITPEVIKAELQQRFQSLPVQEALQAELLVWEQRAIEIRGICTKIEGVHRWMNGKVLLRDVVYQEIVNVHTPFSKVKKKQFVEALADIARVDPPKEIVGILRKFGVSTL